MKKLFLTIATTMLLLGCSKDGVEDKHTYYKFSNSDYELIIKYNYVPNQIITYQNQFGEQLHFKVISNEIKKYGQYSSSFAYGGSSLDYYYDNKTIRLEVIENQSNNVYDLVIYNFSKSEGIFKNALNFPILNVSNSTFYDEIDRPFNISLYSFNNSFKTPLNINNHTFNRVIIYESNNNSILPIYHGGILEKNINKVYYDYDFGIIQFDDINGKQWKVLYP
jgi:hypothetical protein